MIFVLSQVTMISLRMSLMISLMTSLLVSLDFEDRRLEILFIRFKKFYKFSSRIALGYPPYHQISKNHNLKFYFYLGKEA